MRNRFVSASNLLRNLFSSSRPNEPRCRVVGAEALEERVALSGIPGAAPVACSCPFCSGAAYSLGGATEAEYRAITKWTQPGGPGAPVTITYSYSNLLDGRVGLSPATVKAAIQEALSRWAAVAPLRFVEVPDSGPAPSKNDYNQGSGPMIRFGHLSIDGPNNVLAYGYYPGTTGLAGDISFDDTERWRVSPGAGYDLLETAVHEIGHALGLGHEAMPSAGGTRAIMNPYFQGVYRGLGSSYLFADDIAGIRAIYGAGVGSVTPYVGTAPPPSAPAGFSQVGDVLYITGTAAADVFSFTGTGATPSISLNGVTYQGNLASVRSIVFNGGGGVDAASVTGTSSSESFALSPQSLMLSGPRWNVRVINTENIEAIGNTGDQVTLSGSGGSDTLVASPTQARLTGSGYSLLAMNFPQVTANMGQGGDDRAWLYGSAGNDLFVSTPSTARLSGSGYSITTNSFSAVYAYSMGGADTATLNGSNGDDTLTATPTSARLVGKNNAFTSIVSGYAFVTVNGGNGFDTANLTDSRGNDNLVIMAGSTSLRGVGYSLIVNNFRQVNLNSQGGTDRVTVYDSSGNDTVRASGQTASIQYPSSTVTFSKFTSATFMATVGGVNTRRLGTTSVKLDFWGNWM